MGDEDKVMTDGLKGLCVGFCGEYEGTLPMIGRTLIVFSVVLLGWCATHDWHDLSQFGALSLPNSADYEADCHGAKTAPMGKACLRGLVRTNGAHEQLAVYWLSATTVKGSTVKFDRGKVALTVRVAKNDPVGPCQGAYRRGASVFETGGLRNIPRS